MRRIALSIQYDGTLFNGWQLQKSGRTVQYEIERCCSLLFRHPVSVVVSGRTDTGVHAIGQIVHLNTESLLPLEKICFSLNGMLPSDISVTNAFDVDESFHARFSATMREYLYIINNNQFRSPFLIFRATWVPRHIDTEKLNAYVRLLIGTHDFASFCKKQSAIGENTIRTIHDISIECKDGFIFIRIKGNAFLHNMIRSIVGTALYLEKRGADVSQMTKILAACDRDSAWETAPAQGLYLFRVSYDPDLSQYKAARPGGVPAALIY